MGIKIIKCVCGCGEKKVIATCICESEMHHIHRLFPVEGDEEKEIKCGDLVGFKCPHCGYEIDVFGIKTDFKQFAGPKKVYYNG